MTSVEVTLPLSLSQMLLRYGYKCKFIFDEWVHLNDKTLDRLDLVVTLGSRTARETLP